MGNLALFGFFSVCFILEKRIAQKIGKMRIKNEMGRGILVPVGNNGEKIRNIASIVPIQIKTPFAILFRMFIFPPPQSKYHNLAELYMVIKKFS